MTYRNYVHAMEISKQLFEIKDETTMRLELVKMIRRLGPITTVDLLEIFARVAIERHADYEDFQQQVETLLDHAHSPRSTT